MCPFLKDVLPGDVEQTIAAGRRNLAMFRQSIPEFEHHITLLDRLDSAYNEMNREDNSAVWEPPDIHYR